FRLCVPVTPAGVNRANIGAWSAGRAGAPDSGKLRVLRFPQDRLIFGPLQIEGRIEADGTIRQQLTLLCPVSAGTRCIRGNLLVLPVGNSFLYLEPLFVQSTQSKIPELQRVILATQDRIVMADSFERALDVLFGQAPAPAPGTTPAPTPPGTTPPPAAGVAELVKAASMHYQQ